MSSREERLLEAQRGKHHVKSSVGWSIGMTILGLVAVTALVVGAVALHFTISNPVLTVTASGAVNADWTVQYLAGSGARAMTLGAAQLGPMSGREYSIFSTTAAAHTITLSGGATWDGTNTVATFPATAGTGIVFRVLSPATVIAILSNVGPVVFS